MNKEKFSYTFKHKGHIFIYEMEDINGKTERTVFIQSGYNQYIGMLKTARLTVIVKQLISLKRNLKLTDNLKFEAGQLTTEQKINHSCFAYGQRTGDFYKIYWRNPASITGVTLIGSCHHAEFERYAEKHGIKTGVIN